MQIIQAATETSSSDPAALCKVSVKVQRNEGGIKVSGTAVALPSAQCPELHGYIGLVMNAFIVCSLLLSDETDKQT